MSNIRKTVTHRSCCLSRAVLLPARHFFTIAMLVAMAVLVWPFMTCATGSGGGLWPPGPLP
jgi:hypothetical protein